MSRGTKVPTGGSLDLDIPEPHSGQKRWEAVRCRFMVLRVARRLGKTTWGKRLALRCMLGIPPHVETGAVDLTPGSGGKVGWFSPNNKLATEVWRDMVRRLRPLIESVGGRISEQERRIELSNGGVFEIWSVHDNPDSGRGRDYDLCVLDEAGLMPDLSTIWEGAVMPTLSDRAPHTRGIILGTPKGGRTAFNMMYEDAASGSDPDWSAQTGKTIENEMLPGIVEEVARAKRRAERRGTLPLFYQEYEGTPADDGSNPIGLEAIKSVVTPTLRIKENELWHEWRPANALGVPSNRPVAAWGVDLARSVDFTVVIGLDEFGKWAQCHRFQADWRKTKERLIDIIGFGAPVVMDATGVGSPIVQDLYNAGMDVTPFVFTYRSRTTLIEELTTGIHGHRTSLPDNFVRLELESLGVEQTQIGPRYTVPTGMHDDGCFSFCLAWRCFQHVAGIPEWLPERIVPDPNRDPTRFLPAGSTPKDDDADFEILGSGW